MTARVVSTRMDLLRGWTVNSTALACPTHSTALPPSLDETIAGTRSVIHGDLNLENVLVGPGSLVWLIDFAQTREGHPLFDFAHLESELIAHVLAVRAGSPRAYLDLWQSREGSAAQCLHRHRRALPVRPGPPARISPGAVSGLPGRAEISEPLATGQALPVPDARRGEYLVEENACLELRRRTSA